MQILTNSIIRDIENFEIHVRNTDIWPLILHASTQIYYESQFMLLGQKNACILGYVGKGNNGADTLMALCFLMQHGHLGYAYLSHSPEQMNTYAQKALKHFLQAGGRLLDPTLPLRADLALDGLLGTGSRKGLGDEISQALEHWHAQSHRLTLAIDLPSGLDPDYGESHALTLKADHTLCLGFGKKGLWQKNAAAYTGSIEIAPMPFEAPSQDEGRVLVRADLKPILPQRSPWAHKGQMGQVQLFCGSPLYPGAAQLCQLGALSSGCGLVLCTSSDFPEVIPSLELKNPQALMFGPGCGLGDKPKAQLLQLWHTDLPLLVDADGLTLMAQMNLRQRKGPLALSPHPKEAARLLSWTVEEVLAKPQECALEICRIYNACVYLKGHKGVLAHPSQGIWQMAAGNSILARGGSGDLLAGLWAGLMARTQDTCEAALCALWLHGRGSDLCRWKFGAEGYKNSQLPWGIGRAWMELRS